MPYDFRSVRDAQNPERVQSLDSLAKQATARQAPRIIVRFAILFSCALTWALVAGACAIVDGEGEAVVQENLKVKNLEIVDDDGNTRAVFTTISGGRPSLTLLDNNGDFRVWLTLNDDGSPNLLLFDQGRIVLMDGVGGIRSTYGLDATNNPAIRYFSQAGNIRSSAALDESGDPIMELFSESGQVLWSAP